MVLLIATPEVVRKRYLGSVESFGSLLHIMHETKGVLKTPFNLNRKPLELITVITHLT